MKKLVLFFFLCSLAMMSYGERKEGVEQKNVYIFGVTTDLNDSLQYVSTLQCLPKVELENKTKFLKFRSIYSFQFERYIESLNGGVQTGAVIFSPKEKKAAREYRKILRRLNKRFPGYVRVDSTFKFEKVHSQADYMENMP